MYEKYLPDYYRSKIGPTEIVNSEGKTAVSSFRKWLLRNGLKPRGHYFSSIDTGIPELNQVMRTRYTTIANRCRGVGTCGNYKGTEYMSIIEWVDFCNANKDTLKALWRQWETGGWQQRDSISVDRMDESVGYEVENIRFVTHGYNSWRRSIRPIKVNHNDTTQYFMSAEEASEFYGLRKQTIGEILLGKPYAMKGYDVEEATEGDVLQANGVKDDLEYYETFRR